MSQPASVKISLNGVTKRFGGLTALKDVTLSVPAGKKSVLIGPAASGKTVLMKCLAGIHRPDRGTITVDGLALHQASEDERTDLMNRVGVLFQQGGLFDSLRVWENIAFKLIHNFGMSRTEAREVAIAKLAMVNLRAPTADLLPSELSGGMQKRVGIARALAGEPSLLLLDEPTAGLDPITTAVINRLINRSIHEIGATVFSITSDMESAVNEYDQLFMLHKGALVWSGPTHEVESSGNDYVKQLVRGNAQGPIRMRVGARTLPSPS